MSGKQIYEELEQKITKLKKEAVEKDQKIQELRQRIDAIESRSPRTDTDEYDKIHVSGINVEWNVNKGTCTFEKLPVAMMWVDTTLAGLMSGVQAMVGTERFLLALQSEGRNSVEDDWQVISRFPDFREGFKAIANIAAVAGWGDWQLISLNEKNKECRFQVQDSWEGRYQHALGVCWGSGMLAGKMAGYCSRLFEINCWSEQTSFIANGDPFDEFVVKPSDRSIEKEIENLLATDEATRADMAVALQKLGKEVAERQQAESSLRGSEERWQAIVNNAVVGIYQVTAEGKFVLVNPKLAQIFGFKSPEEFLGSVSNITELYVHPEERLPILQEINTSGFVDGVEALFRRKDGQNIWIRISARVIKGPSKETIYEGFMVDVTEHKKAIDDLRISEEKFSKAFHSSPNLMAITRVSDGQYLDVNESYVRITGFGRDEVIGHTLRDLDIFVNYEDRKKMGEMLKKQGAIHDVESRIRSKTGEERIGLVSAEIIEIGDERCVLSIMDDITDRKLAAEALRSEKEKFQVLVEESPFGVSLIGANSRYKYLNPKFIEIFGYTLEDIPTGKEWFRKAFPNQSYRNQVISTWINDQKESTIGEARPRIFNVRCKDGSDKVIHFRPVTMETDDQLVIYEDITEQKRLETQLQQAQKMEAIGTLAGGIAHDFNNILGAIIAYTEMTLLDISDESPLHYNLGQVLKASGRAAELVKQILAFSRQSEQKRRPIGMIPILKESLKLLRASLPSTIELRQDISIQCGTILAEPTQIQQVLMNLCTNAAHAMRDKGGVLNVKLKDTFLDADRAAQFPDLSPGPHLNLIISDTGHGMDSSVLERIFDPYFTTKEKGVGTGLGLATVHGIVKSYGGTITVESEVKRGSTFSVYFPVIEKEEIPETIIEKPLPIGKERILFVDDEKILVDVGQQMLERLGYEVVTRISSIDALELFSDQPYRFDLVITDMTMPQLTGEKLAKRLMEIRRDIPVILCTGYSELISDEKAKNIGIQAFIMKPLVLRELAKTVRNVLDQ